MPKHTGHFDFLRSRWVELAKQSDAAKRVRKEFPKWVKKAKNSELVRRAQQLWDHFNSGNVSGTEKVLVIAALLYLISPVDLVPDFIPIAGLLDDAAVAGLVLDYVLKQIEGKGRKSKAEEKVGPILRAVAKAVKGKTKK
jgi:uncharacterized membrane protein YkvA (DUF1232 family)